MTNSIQPQIARLQPYQAGMSIDELARTYNLDPAHISKLASNENPYGPSPAAIAAAQQALQDVRLYPDSFALQNTLAARFDNLKPANIVLGNGSNDVLDLIARVYLGPETEAIAARYSFLVYDLVTTLVGAQPVTTPDKDYGHDLQAMLDAITEKTRVIWIANPNNPTGTFIDHATLKAFLDQVPPHIMVVLDEAYYEYLSEADSLDTSAWVTTYSNLILVRTFSKIYGLAGLRIGYGIAQPAVIELLNRARQPFNVNSVGLAAALASLDDTEHVTRSQSNNATQRTRLARTLEELHIPFIPSQANFITIQAANAKAWHESLLRAGIIVRPLANYGLTEHLRITIGTPAENDQLIAELGKLTQS